MTKAANTTFNKEAQDAKTRVIRNLGSESVLSIWSHWCSIKSNQPYYSAEDVTILPKPYEAPGFYILLVSFIPSFSKGRKLKQGKYLDQFLERYSTLSQHDKDLIGDLSVTRSLAHLPITKDESGITSVSKLDEYHRNSPLGLQLRLYVQMAAYKQEMDQTHARVLAMELTGLAKKERKARKLNNINL
jgi:hypothetical protein